MLSNALKLFWAGIFQGFGLEFSFIVLWVGWSLLHKQVAHKFNPEHLFHKIHDYFN